MECLHNFVWDTDRVVQCPEIFLRNCTPVGSFEGLVLGCNGRVYRFKLCTADFERPLVYLYRLPSREDVQGGRVFRESFFFNLHARYQLLRYYLPRYANFSIANLTVGSIISQFCNIYLLDWYFQLVSSFFFFFTAKPRKNPILFPIKRRLSQDKLKSQMCTIPVWLIRICERCCSSINKSISHKNVQLLILLYINRNQFVYTCRYAINWFACIMRLVNNPRSWRLFAVPCYWLNTTDTQSVACHAGEDANKNKYPT